VTRLITQLVQKRRQRQLWRRLTKALGIGRRPAESSGVATLNQVSTHLEIEWYARDVHPWDRDLPDKRKAVLFAEASLAQTATAIRRAFERFPEVSSLSIRVLAPRKPHGLLFSGSVLRRDLEGVPGHLSPAMTLKLLGIDYQLIDGVLEPLT
jgi:hypothetical protein